jgi:uncharacterized membrane protein YtjA (UPF0391 family)
LLDFTVFDAKPHAQTGCRIRYTNEPTKGDTMLSWTIILLIVAVIAGVLGFTGIAGTAAWIAQTLFVIFLVLFLVSLLMGRRPSV